MTDRAWQAIFHTYHIDQHNFAVAPFLITADEIKEATKQFTATNERESRILCKHDTRESRPSLFRELGLFILPIKNGEYAILQGEGYVDIPNIETTVEIHPSELDFKLDTVLVGNSEMQHVDYAYAASLIRSAMDDDSLVLTIRGRKYTPEFAFRVGNIELETKSVQTEIDAGYEGREQVVLVEAKNASTTNTIIRQLYYPYRQWSAHTNKRVNTVFFEKQGQEYKLWQFEFDDRYNYNSIRLVCAARYTIKE
jgi:hypothetical protein